MSAATMVTTVVKSSPYLARMSLSLFWMYLTLGSRVRKTRKAFEKQLMQQGMSKEDAKRLSACFEELKNNITGTIRQGMARSFSTQVVCSILVVTITGFTAASILSCVAYLSAYCAGKAGRRLFSPSGIHKLYPQFCPDDIYSLTDSLSKSFSRGGAAT